ncbi:hypothetical protein B8U84_19525 [Acinetobacter baumannii]|nr:hypothetical protein B8U84_19525 [Acinetobacter baumannii]
MGSCAAPSAKGDDKFITTDYLQQCQKSRLEILLLLAALVNWFHYLLGSAAEKAGLHLRYQANTVKNRRVLALNFLGILLCKEPKQRIRRQYYQQGLKQILQWVVQWDWAVIKQADS